MRQLIKGLMKWASENPQNAGALILALLAGGKGASKVIKNVSRIVTTTQEQYNKDHRVYDHSLGIYLRTNHKLTKHDLEMIDRLRRKGYSKSQAMMKLNLLKD